MGRLVSVCVRANVFVCARHEHFQQIMKSRTLQSVQRIWL